MKHLSLFLFVVVAVSAYGQSKIDTLPNLPEHYKDRLAKFRAEPVTTGKIIFVGNSITEGGNWRKLLKDSSVMNRGISGDNSFGLLQRIDEIVRHKPSAVYLLIGINDFSKNIPTERVLENIFSIVRKIQSGTPKTKIYVQSILPVNPKVKGFPGQFNKSYQVEQINIQLKKYGDAFKYTYIDIHSAFTGKSGDVLEESFTYDGLHLNSAGYLHWIEYLKKNSFL